MKFLLIFSVFGAFANDPKTAVLILYSETHPVYPKMQEVWRSYMHKDPEHFTCYFLRAKEDLESSFLIDGDTIWIKGQDNYIPGLLNKTILAFHELDFRAFDYVLRTNISSFYIFPRLLEFLKRAPVERFYCGIHHGEGTKGHEAGWVCGAGIILSKDLVQLLLEHKEKFLGLSSEDRMNIDDVAIADFLTAHNVPITTGEFYREFYTMNEWYRFCQERPSDVFHFRVRTKPAYRSIGDLMIHRRLYQMFY
jgi:hypothetical protein